MLIDIIWALVGLLLLYFGGEYLVKGSSSLALSLGVSAGIIGLTVVASGTSSPELLVSLIAIINGSSDISLGNVVGSNLANVGLILGITAIILPLSVNKSFLKKDMPVMLAASVLYFIFALSGVIARQEGIFLLVFLVAYLTYYAFYTSKKNKKVAPKEDENSAQPVKTEDAVKKTSKLKAIVHIIMGILFLIAGGNLLIESAMIVARGFGISEWIIALTMVAVGTSLPELATSIVAALRREPEIVIGNIIGSNIFNILLVQGTVAVIHPVSVQKSFLTFEFPAMLITALILFFFLKTKNSVSRKEGVFLLFVYMLVIIISFFRG